MTINLDTIAPQHKLELISSGEEFGSEDTYAQATQTGQGFKKYGDNLKLYGIPLSDALRLSEAQAMLYDAGFGRNLAKTKRRTLVMSLDDAAKNARTARLRGRAVSSTARAELAAGGHVQLVIQIDEVIKSTADSETEGEDLAKQHPQRR